MEGWKRRSSFAAEFFRLWPGSCGARVEMEEKAPMQGIQDACCTDTAMLGRERERLRGLKWFEKMKTQLCEICNGTLRCRSRHLRGR